MVTKKDFKAVAEIIKNNQNVVDGQPDYTSQAVAKRLADYFEQENPRFDRSRFMKACGLTE